MFLNPAQFERYAAAFASRGAAFTIYNKKKTTKHNINYSTLGKNFKVKSQIADFFSCLYRFCFCMVFPCHAIM